MGGKGRGGEGYEGEEGGMSSCDINCRKCVIMGYVRMDLFQ